MSLARPLLLSAGVLCVAIGTVGVMLPLLPSVPFYLLAAFCFARSHPAWEQRLLDHPVCGPPLRDWRQRGAISRRGKRAALTMMAAGAVVTWVLVGWPWALPASLVVAGAGAWIWRRPD